MKFPLCILLALYSTITHTDARRIFILIHGTWAADTDWHLPGGTFYNELEKSCHACHATLIPYNWSGKLNHESRVQAAKGLVKIIQSYDEHTHIYLIGHSHGGNVAALVSQYLSYDLRNKHTIKALYTLGTPIDYELYVPNMDIIEYVYNFFSRGDYVQHIFGTYDREYPNHERIANVRVTINDKEPSHSNLHHPLIAQWLPKIPHELASAQINGFHLFCCINQGSIHFYPNKPPHYYIDFRARVQDSHPLQYDQECH